MIKSYNFLKAKLIPFSYVVGSHQDGPQWSSPSIHIRV